MKKFFIGLAMALSFFLLIVTGSFAQYDNSIPTRSNGNSVSSSGSMSESPTYQWQFDTALSYSSGDYGTSTTTHTLYWPFSLKRLFEPGDVFFTVPFLYQKAGSGVTAFNGRPFQTNRTVLRTNNDETGLGDMRLGGHYYLLKEAKQGLNLNLLGQVKFPTADEKKGLGTGEFDETVGLESSKALNDLWNLYADFYYSVIGDPPGIDFDNMISFDAGVGYQFTPKTEATVFYRESTALLDNRENPRDILLGANHKMSEQTKIDGNVGFGLSDGSPDVSVTAGMSYLF